VARSSKPSPRISALAARRAAAGRPTPTFGKKAAGDRWTRGHGGSNHGGEISAVNCIVSGPDVQRTMVYGPRA